MITIIDNNMGNIQSVANAMDFLGVKCQISNKENDIISSSGLILPGVGAFPMAMKNLNTSGLDELLIDLLQKKEVPFLGICLGMQLLFEKSHEKETVKGLGILKGEVVRIEKNENNSVPHVGWNNLTIKKNNPLTININENSMFYYDHSYFIRETESNSFAVLNYGQEMCVGVSKKNIFGVQFHPEKSQKNGLRMLRNFSNYVNLN